MKRHLIGHESSFRSPSVGQGSDGEDRISSGRNLNSSGSVLNYLKLANSGIKSSYGLTPTQNDSVNPSLEPTRESVGLGIQEGETDLFGPSRFRDLEIGQTTLEVEGGQNGKLFCDLGSREPVRKRVRGSLESAIPQIGGTPLDLSKLFNRGQKSQILPSLK
jgi:hypothetical protein